MSGSLESLGKEGTGPRIEHLIGNRATFPTLSTPLQGADEWYAGIVIYVSWIEYQIIYFSIKKKLRQCFEIHFIELLTYIKARVLFSYDSNDI